MTHELHDNETDRLEAFSDGVFAIAITLLILEIGVPHVTAGQSLGRELLDLWPSYFAYATSYAVIGIIWANHHSLFRLVHRADHLLLMINLGLLMCVAFIPFPTALVAEYLHAHHEESVPVATYGVTLTITSVVFNGMWFYLVRNRATLLHTGISNGAIRRRTWRNVLGIVLYGASVPLAFVNVWISLAIYVGLALFYVIPTGD